MIIPNLFILGFQKCGSSTLFDLLVKHPDIIGSEPKETFFLSDPEFKNFNFLHNISNPEASWDHFFPGAKPHTYYLEGSVLNFFQDNAKNYFRKNPAGKFIFILRDPVERFISNYKFYYNRINGIDASVDIKAFFELVKQRKYTQQALRNSVEHGRYVRYIEEWKKIVGEENICIIGLKELALDHNAVMEKITGFLGLSSFRVETLKKRNVSRKAINPGLHKGLYKIFGGRIPFAPALRSLYVGLFKKEFSVKIDDEMRQALTLEYAEEYAALSKYF